MFEDANVLHDLQKPDAKLEKISGDSKKYHKSIRRFKMKISPAYADEDECLKYLKHFTSCR